MSLFGKSTEPTTAKRPEAQPVRPPASPAPAAPHASAAPAARPTPSSTASTPCVVGAKTTIKGELLGDEDVHVEGTVEGQIRISRDVRVGPTGVVRATVEAASVVISGELIGDCSATSRVEIQASGRLTGNIKAPKIVVAEGAVFRGNSDMSSPARAPERR
jgi:cytoskeletal protein CcmA (bactofilin family)